MQTKPSISRGAERKNITKEKRTRGESIVQNREQRAHGHVHNTMSFAEISVE
jgi:hypothetical protein